MTQLYENILLAISGLRANKMRALLTMLGIIIGIGSVIGIVMVGDSMTNSMTSSLQEMGANTVQISLQQRESENGTSYSVYMDEEDYINDEMIEAFLQDYGDVVESVSLQESMGSGRVTEGHRYANVSISGVNSGYQSANHLTMLGGRFIGDKDNKGVKNVAVVSDRLVNNMFGQGQNPLGKEIKVNCGKEQYTFTIIGVYQYEQNAMMAMMGAAASDADITTDLFIPIQTEWKLTGTIEGYYYINVMTKQGTDSRALAQDFQDYFNRFYTRNQDFQIMAISLDSVIDQYASMMGTVQVAIAVIAAISLLVGGIGVMNIMLVSVTERTRDWHPQGAGSQEQCDSDAVYRRVGHYLFDWRYHRHHLRNAVGLCRRVAAGTPCPSVGGCHSDCSLLLDGNRRLFWLLSSQQGCQAGPNRSTAL